MQLQEVDGVRTPDAVSRTCSDPLSLAQTRIFSSQARVWFGTFEPVPWDPEDA